MAQQTQQLRKLSLPDTLGKGLRIQRFDRHCDITPFDNIAMTSLRLS